MEKNLIKQYNNFAEKFSKAVEREDNISRKAFYESVINIDMEGKEVLDLACGDGQDIPFYRSMRANCYGLDSSEELIKIANDTLEGDFIVGDMRKLPYKDDSFDVVLSKYALGTVEDIETVFSEVERVLKPGGTFVYLTTHPMRLFLEQKYANKGELDYFKKKNVDLSVFGGSFVITEPTHTFNDFLSSDFLKRFDLKEFSEHYDPQSADFPDRDVYPDFFVIKAIKRDEQ